MRGLTGLIAIAALAGCGEVAPDAPAPAQGTATSATAVAPSPTIAASSTAAPTRITQFPAALHGTWGLTPGDCDPSRGDDKGVMTITADEARFYESRARLGEVTAAADGTLNGTFAFTGEGQEWTRTIKLTPSEGGTVLIREDLVTEPTAEPAEGPLRYTRCPAKAAAQ